MAHMKCPECNAIFQSLATDKKGHPLSSKIGIYRFCPSCGVQLSYGHNRTKNIFMVGAALASTFSLAMMQMPALAVIGMLCLTMALSAYMVYTRPLVAGEKRIKIGD